MLDSKSTVVAAIISALISGIVSYTISNSDISAKYVEIATGVLSTKSGNNDKALREWAIKVINKYADESLKISGDLESRLINGETSLSGFASSTSSASGALNAN